MNENMISKSFLVVWAGQLLSAVGSGLTAFALGIYVFQMTHSAVSYSLVIFFSFLPSFVLLPFTGALADRFDRKKLMVIGDMGATIGLIFILAVMVSGNLELRHIYFGVTLSSLFTAVQTPAYKAMVTDHVEKEHYARASGLIQMAGTAQYLISPALAGVLLKFFEINTILIIDIGTFIIASAAVFIIKKQCVTARVHTKQKFSASIIESFKYLYSKKGILCLALLVSLVCFNVALMQSLFGPMMLALTDSGTLGIALSLSASGMLFGSIIICIWGLKKNVSTLSVFLIMTGLFYALMGVFTKIPLIVVFGFLFFCTLAYVNTSLDVLIRSNVDNEKQGRIWALVYSLSQAGYLAAFGSAGFLADNMFCPLFNSGGALTRSLGAIIGTGQGRGIGFMFILSGIFIAVIAVILGRTKSIRLLEAKPAEELPV